MNPTIDDFKKDLSNLILTSVDDVSFESEVNNLIKSRYQHIAVDCFDLAGVKELESDGQ